MKKKSLRQFKSALKKHLKGNFDFTLPADFYTDESWLFEETEQLLNLEWHCLGRSEEIPGPGNYFTLDLLGEPLLVVRGEDKVIRVLSNVCRHRNMKVAEGSGKSKSFVCPYHAWSYQIDGTLLRAPYMEDLDKKKCALPEFKSEIWQGFIYVNLSDEAKPLAPRLKGLDKILANYHSADMHHVFVEEELWEANWKCLVENFMEGYHLSRVHPQTLGGRTPTQLCKKYPGANGYTGYKAYYPTTAPMRGEGHPDLTDDEKNCSTLFCVYPSHVASQSKDVLSYIALQPAGPNQVKIRWGLSVYNLNMPQQEIDAIINLWKQINSEDKAKLGKLQSALHSRHAHAGPLAPDDMEGTIRDFHGYLARHLVTDSN